MKIKSERCTLLFGVLLFVSLTISCLTFGIGPAPIELDAAHYWKLAGDAADGDWLQLQNGVDYRTPLYPAVLGVYRYLFGTHALMAVVVSQHLVILTANLLAAFICWRITGSHLAALACYGLCAFSLMRPWFANLICPEPLFMLLFIAAFGALCAYHQRPGFAKSITFGVLIGLAILVRPVPKLLWIPLIGLFCFHATNWVVEIRPRKILLGHAIVAAAALTLMLSPCYARNWALFGKPFVARLPPVNKWQVCFQGTSAARLAIPDTPSGRRLLSLIGSRDGDVADRYCASVVATLEKKGLPNEEIDQLISRACQEAIWAQPGEFAWPTFKRFVNFWRCTADGIPYYNVSPNSQYYGQKTWGFGALSVQYQRLLRNSPAHWLRWNELCTVLFGAGTLWMMFGRRTRLIGASLALMFLYFAAVTSIVEVENYKYRVFLEPLMIVATVCGGVIYLEFRMASSPGSTRRPELEDTVPYGLPLRRLLEASGHLKPEVSTEVDTRADRISHAAQVDEDKTISVGRST